MKTRFLLAALAVGSLAVAGCGSDDDDASGDGGTPDPARPRRAR